MIETLKGLFMSAECHKAVQMSMRRIIPIPTLLYAVYAKNTCLFSLRFPLKPQRRNVM